jgi:hypothetical protein
VQGEYKRLVRGVFIHGLEGAPEGSS